MVAKTSPYDAEVEYLKTDFSSGYPYIATGILATTSIRLEMKCSFQNTSTGRHGAYSNNARFYFGVASGKWICGLNSTSYNHNIATADNNVHDFVMSSEGFYIDGVKKVNSGSASSNVNIWIFNANGTPSYPKCCVYSCKIYNGDVLVRDFIPVRKGHVGYLYDKVSGTLFGKTNQQANNFILGPDKNT